MDMTSTRSHQINKSLISFFKGKGKQLEDKMVQKLQEDVDMEDVS